MGTSLDQATSAKVLRQVEFYFSDSNLPQDKFLQQCIQESDDGFVSLPMICSFKRMRSHLGLKEAGPDKVPLDTTTAVAEVLRKSENLKLSDDGKKVGPRTTNFMSEETKAAVDARSVAAGPLCWTKHLEELETFFSLHMLVKSVRLPRHPNKKTFCGFAVIELVSEDEAKKALELKLTYDGVELEIKTRKELDEELEKSKLEQDTPNNEQQMKQPSKNKNARHDLMEESYPKGLIVAFSLQKRLSEEASTKEVSKEASESDAKEQDLKEEVAGTSSEQLKEGDEITREDLKEVLNKFGTVKFVDYSRGAASGFVRFEDADAAQKARGAAVLAEEGGLIVKDHLATLEALEDEAEKGYWAKIRGAQDNVRGSKQKHHRKNDRFGGRGKKQQHDNNYMKPNSNLGKHKRFDEDDSVDEHFTKQSKSQGAAV